MHVCVHKTTPRFGVVFWTTHSLPFSTTWASVNADVHQMVADQIHLLFISQGLRKISRNSLCCVLQKQDSTA